MNTEDRRVIIIDTEGAWSEFASTTLMAVGYQVLTILADSNTAELADKIKTTAEKSISLIDFDVFSGDPIIAAVLFTHRIPVVVLYVVDPSPEQLGTVFQQGAFDCVGKPYDENGLVALVYQAFADARIITRRRENLVTRAGAVLVIDDDPMWLKVLVDALLSMTTVDTATSRSIAEQKILERDYDLVVCDLRLTETDEITYEGLDLMARLRDLDRERGKFTQIIVSSGYGTPEHVRESYRRYGTCYYVDKRKFSPVRYQDAIRDALGKRNTILQ